MQNKNTTNIMFNRLLAILALLALALSSTIPVGLAAPLPASSGISSLGVVQQWSISAPDPAALDEFGYAVDIDGNTAVVGARNADLNPGKDPISDAGAAYVFVHTGKTWILDGTLTAKDASAGDTFGVAVAISGNTVVVGATGVNMEDPDDENEELRDVGAAYIFTRSSGSWEQQAKLTASDPGEEDSFGSAVAIHKNTVVVSSANKTFNIGSAYVFVRSGVKNWEEKARLGVFPPTPGENFGASVAVYGNRIAVGATQIGPGIPSNEGRVYLFRRNGDWGLEATLEAENGRDGDAFGSSVALDGDTVVVGANHADPDLGGGRVTSAGAAYVFADKGDDWEQTGLLTASNGVPFDQFGGSVDIDNDTIVVGAEGAAQMGNPGAGAVYVFKKTGSGWAYQTRAVTNPAEENDSFGRSVAISRDWFLAGASGRDPGSKTRAGEAFVNLLGPVQLPATGFAPYVQTSLPEQPASLAYQQYGQMTLEIPALHQAMSIVGVPKSGPGWDVRWLGGEAGYLEGTAFPTWQGNSGLVGHATLSNGEPGPFAHLEDLRFGDQVIVHAWGQKYVYEVRENSMVAPNQTYVLRHEKLSWLTLVTCQGFDEVSGTYRWRRIVRAVVVAVTD